MKRANRAGWLSVVSIALLAVSGAGLPANAMNRDLAPPLTPVAAGRPEQPFARAPQVPAAGLPPELQATTRIVFQSRRTGNDEIFFGDGNFAHEVQLTNNPASDITPRLNRGATRIVFASNRDGNYEIYSMNTAGGDLRRLTNNAADDLNPAWMPDGNSILFASTRDGDSEIYRMDADGGTVTRLTSLIDYDGQPRAAPDASRIVFIADRRGEGRLVWLMDPDGANRVSIGPLAPRGAPVFSPNMASIAFHGIYSTVYYDSLFLMDPQSGNLQVLLPTHAASDWETFLLRMGAFSPDGQYVAFTRGRFLDSDLSENAMTAANLEFMLTTSGNGYYYALTSGDFDQNVDWQPLDGIPPSSAASALPPVSPGVFTITVLTDSATDHVSLQARDGITGTWVTVANVSGASTHPIQYHGISGHTYYFRSRAYDQVFNYEPRPDGAETWTTVEALPPVSSMEPLALLARARRVDLRWSGVDPGGSGIAGYDLQVRIGQSGAWTDVVTRTRAVSGTYEAQSGQQYFFRVRAVDDAGNVEAWPPGDGDATTFIFAAEVGGDVRDSADTPVVGAIVSVDSGLIDTSVSLDNGQYFAVALASAKYFTASASKPGYGWLPSAQRFNRDDATVNFWLPPADDTVRNGHFEGPILPSDWRSERFLLRRTELSDRNTGEAGLRFGGAAYPVVPLPSASNATCARVALEPNGRASVFWLERGGGQERARFAALSEAGAWSEVGTIFGSFTSGTGAPQDSCPDFGIDPAGHAHAVWRTWPDGNAYYASRGADGNWSVFQFATDLEPDSEPRLGLAPSGAFHLVWSAKSGTRRDILTLFRDEQGAWHGPDNLTAGDPYLSDARHPAIAVDSDGNAFLAWQNGVGFVSRRPPNGSWSAPEVVFSWPFTFANAQIAATPGAGARAVWLGAAPGVTAAIEADVYLTRAMPARIVYAVTQTLAVDSLVVDDGGRAHLALTRGDGLLTHAVQDATGAWTTSSMNPKGLPADRASLALVQQDLWAAWRETSQTGQMGSHCARLRPGFGWVDFGVCMEGVARPALAASAGRLHLVSVSDQAGLADATWLDTARGTARVSQILTLPLTSTSPGLSFMYRFTAGAPGDTPTLTVTADAGEDADVVLTRTHETGGEWRHVWHSMTAWAGKTITLTFAFESTEGAAQLLLDEVSLGSTAPNLWAALYLPPNAGPGSTAVFTAAYGNMGGGFAGGNTLTVTLPAGISFVAADPAPATTAPALVWTLIDLAGQGAPMSIQITATVDASATLGSPLTMTAGIRTATPELELANNNAAALILPAYRAYLPLASTP